MEQATINHLLQASAKEGLQIKGSSLIEGVHGPKAAFGTPESLWIMAKTPGSSFENEGMA